MTGVASPCTLLRALVEGLNDLSVDAQELTRSERLPRHEMPKVGLIDRNLRVAKAQAKQLFEKHCG